MEGRKGSQIPTASRTLPYAVSKGEEAVNYYNSTGRTAQEWQELLSYDILAVNEDGLWTHAAFGLAVPRQNGKNEVIAIRELWGLHNGERILHTAHYAKTSTAAFHRLCKLLEDSGVREIKGKNRTGYKAGKSKGQEFIELSPEFGGGHIEFRTRTTTGGLGESFDLLVIDEAQEYRDEHRSALQYTIAAAQNPQTVYIGTPPTAYSSGTIFPKLRKAILSGAQEDAGWAEWSIQRMSDPQDRELWYQTNPSLGTLLNERTIAAEITDDPTDFNIQRLGLWLTYNQKSEISRQEWDECKADKLPAFTGKLAVGIKASKDGTVSMAVSARTKDGKIFVECIGNQPLRNGTEWINRFCVQTRAQLHAVVIDGASIQQTLSDSLKAEKIKAVTLPTVAEVVTANAQFEQMIIDKTVCHMGQPALTQAVTNCEKRAIGSKGGFGFASQKDAIDISLMDAALLAAWAITDIKSKKFIAAY